MVNWKSIRKKYFVLEILSVVGIVLCFIIGSVCDWFVAIKGLILIYINDIASFSLTVLQIQATLGALSIAIIALLTGAISDSYMGISVSDYYLNIRPWKLKQKVLIFVSLGLCLFGVFFHSLKLYNLVTGSFVATLIVISISIIEIYSAFGGKNVGNREIEAYINYILESDIDYNKKVNILQNYVLDWKKNIDSQDKESYEKYFDIFQKYLLVLWKSEMGGSTMVIQQQCYSMLYCFFGSEKALTKERGIDFLQNIYLIIWKEILKCKSKEELLNKSKVGFSLFTEIGSEMLQSIDDLSIECVERKLLFSYFVDSVQRVAVWFIVDEKENCELYRHSVISYENEISELIRFSRYIGYYLAKQKQKNSIVNQRIWVNILNRWSAFSSYNIPEDKENIFLKDRVVIYFNYCYGLLLNGHENIVKEGVYFTGINNAIKLNNKYQALFYLLVHCYLYYLAERESEDCITENVKLSAKNILNDVEAKGAFGSLISMLVENAEWLDIEMYKNMRNILKGYELYPKYFSAKRMIIEDVVTDFYIFLILFMDHEYYLPELLERNISDTITYRYVSTGQEVETKRMFTNLFKLIFVGNKIDTRIDVEVGLLYDKLEKFVKKKQKEKYVELAKEAQQKYEATINEEEIREKIKINVAKRLGEKFSPILVNEDTKNGLIKIRLLTLHENTSFLSQESIAECYSHMEGRFLYGIMMFLYRRKAIEFRDRFDDFLDDREYMNYLETNQLNTLLGSQFILSNRNYKYASEFKRFIEQYETIYTSFVNEGLALKDNAISVCLHDVNVSIHPARLQETEVKWNKETGKYTYSIANGLPIDFDEKELQEYLYNNKKVINITAKVSVQINHIPAGIILTGKRKK